MDVLLQFPGQLSEHVGMDALPLGPHGGTAELFALAERRTGLAVARLCGEGPEAELHADRAAAVAMVTADEAYRRALVHAGGARVVAVAGHSVGFTSALVAAEALAFEDALDVVLLVDEAIDRLLAREGIEGGMGVVVGLGEGEASALAERAGCDVACLNAKSQIALSGRRDAVRRALEAARQAGALAVHEMPMRKPMHARLLAPLQPILEEALARVPLRDPALPLVSHLDGSLVRTAAEARALLARQLGARVRWYEAVAALRTLAPAAVLLECGPGDVLTRLARWIDRSIPARALSQPATWSAMAVPARA